VHYRVTMAPVQRKGLRALQLWCSQVTSDYSNVCVTDLTTSFRDGLAFNAIIHHFRPDLFDYKSLDPADIRENNAHAFRVAEQELNIPALLDPEDMVDCEVPDKQSVATYLAQLYHLFKTTSPPTSPPTRTSLTRLSSSEGENDSLLSTDSPPSFRTCPTAAQRPSFNRSELIAKYGEDIFSCSSPKSRTSSPSPPFSPSPSPSSSPSSNAAATSTPNSASPSARPVAVSQKKNESSAVASVRKQFEQFAKISAS